MLQETLITFPDLKPNTTSSKTISSYNHWMEQFRSFGTQEYFIFDFKNSILKFIRTSPSNVFNCNNYKGIRLITQLRVGMNHLRKHKFKHNFQDCLNPICISNLPHIFFSTVLNLMMNDTPSWAPLIMIANY